MPHNVFAVNGGLVLLQMARVLRPVQTSTNPALPPCPSSARLLRNPLLLLFPLPPSTLITICPFGTFGFSNTSTLSSVRHFGQVPSHPFPHALCHVVTHPLQTSASTPFPLPLQLSKQKGQPRGPSGSCSTFTFLNGGSSLLMLHTLHSNKQPCYKSKRRVPTLAAISCSKSIPSCDVSLSTHCPSPPKPATEQEPGTFPFPRLRL